jgi:hypothetical protein
MGQLRYFARKTAGAIDRRLQRISAALGECGAVFKALSYCPRL